MSSGQASWRDPARWPHVAEICAAVIDMDDRSRASFLDDACVGDTTLREAVESLLAHAPVVERFLSDEPLERTAARPMAPARGELLGRHVGSTRFARRLAPAVWARSTARTTAPSTATSP